MNRPLHLLLLSLALLCLSSCNGDRRMVKKFIYRMNAHEVNAASKYIYPGDHLRLYIFNKEVYAKSPNMMFRILERKKGFADGQKCVFVKLQCENSTSYFTDHMENLGLLHPNDIILDTMFIRQTNKGKSLSFDWANNEGNIQIPENEKFFNLSIFDSLGLIVALAILVVIGVPLFFLRSIISSISSLPTQGVIICVALILGLLYVIYQLLENILFELFLINLPY